MGEATTGIPMLMHESFSKYRIFRETSAFYPSGELIQSLREIYGNTDKLEELQVKISGLPDFNRDYQAGKYVNFLRH